MDVDGRLFFTPWRNSGVISQRVEEREREGTRFVSPPTFLWLLFAYPLFPFSFPSPFPSPFIRGRWLPRCTVHFSHRCTGGKKNRNRFQVACIKRKRSLIPRAPPAFPPPVFLSSNLNVFFSSCIRFPNAFISFFPLIEPVVHGLELLLVEDEPEPGPAETLRASSDIPKSI